MILIKLYCILSLIISAFSSADATNYVQYSVLNDYGYWS